MSSLVKYVEDNLITKKEFPSFSSGDTITVYYEIKEEIVKQEHSSLKVLFYKERDLDHLKFYNKKKCLVQKREKEYFQSTRLP